MYPHAETKYYCVTIEQSFEIYHDTHYADFHNRRGYVIIYIYIYTHIFPVTYVGIYGNKRNPGDEKMAEQKKKCSLIALKQCCLFFRGLKRKKKDYTLASGLKTHLRIDLNSLGKVRLFKENA